MAPEEGRDQALSTFLERAEAEGLDQELREDAQSYLTRAEVRAEEIKADIESWITRLDQVLAREPWNLFAFTERREAIVRQIKAHFKFLAGKIREEYDIERKFRETRLYRVAPLSTNLILSYVATHELGLPRSY